MISDTEVLAALPALWRYAVSLRGKGGDPEDLVQSTCVGAIRFRDHFVGGNAEAWLITMMRNVNANMRRHTGAAKRAGEHLDIEKVNLAVPPRQEAIILAIEVVNAMERLSPEHRRIIAHHIAGHSKQEVAEIEGIPLGTQSSRMNRARARLMEMLK